MMTGVHYGKIVIKALENGRGVAAVIIARVIKGFNER